jgi:glycosyltransferase involved in cell wall biosynthesis
MRFGAGTQIKVLEALACCCPVITTPIGAEALRAVNGKHMIVAEPTANSFAAAVTRLLDDNSLRKRLAENGRELVEEYYTWEKALEPLDKIMEEVARGDFSRYSQG